MNVCSSCVYRATYRTRSIWANLVARLAECSLADTLAIIGSQKEGVVLHGLSVFFGMNRIIARRNIEHATGIPLRSISHQHWPYSIDSKTTTCILAKLCQAGSFLNESSPLIRLYYCRFTGRSQLKLALQAQEM